MEASQRRPKIVVGVDGSPEADAAMHLAYEEALVRRGELVIVHAWQYPPFGPGGDDRRQAEERLAASVERFRTEVDPVVPITEKLVGSDPRYALTAASADADLLVVGSRGLGKVSAAVLGSVSTYVLHHAQCPVEVVPSAVRTATGEGPVDRPIGAEMAARNSGRS